MNNIDDKGYNDCTGCSACAIVCPQKAINIFYNNEGFISPFIDNAKCTSCGLCKEVCYKFLNPTKIIQKSDYENKRVIAVLNNYFEEMHTVSSAGIATQLAKHFFKEMYDICGVVYNPEKDICEHIIAKDETDIEDFKGSKYLQSYNYEAFKKLTQSPKDTLVFGTPCQIYGLKKIAQIKHIENKLVFIDLFCLGVPSFKLWKQYKDFLFRNFRIEGIRKVNFRDKSQGWHKFSIKITDKNGNTYQQNLFNDMFFSFYLKRVCSNKACYNCLFRYDFVYSDIRLGDFWGEKYKIYDDGVGLVVLLTDKGGKAWDKIKSSFRFEECEAKDIFNSQKINKIKLPDKYHEIIGSLANNEPLEEINSKYGINVISYKKENNL